MATTALLFPPSNDVQSGSRTLPTASFPATQSDASSVPDAKISPESIALKWVSSFEILLSGVDTPVRGLFLKESYWRDLLCVTWDFHTLQGPEKITKFIKSSSEDKRIVSVSLDRSAPHKMPQFAAFGSLKVVQAFLKIETSIGRGDGLFRLSSDMDDGGRWKAFTLFTSLQQIKGYEEDVYNQTPKEAGRNLGDGFQTWKDRLVTQRNYEGGREPTVLIFGRLYETKVLEKRLAHDFRLLRCWSKWTHYGCSAQATWTRDIDHRKEPSRRRQLAK